MEILSHLFRLSLYPDNVEALRKRPLAKKHSLMNRMCM